MDFGIDGYVLTNVFGGGNAGKAISIHDDLNIIVAGNAGHPAEYTDVAVVKYYSGLYVGQNEPSKGNPAIRIYPNPAKDHLRIDFRI